MPFSRRAARLTGYAVVVLVLAAGACFGAFLMRDAVRGPLVWVRFPELATLSEGDPVVSQGVAVGVVERITLAEGRPLTALRFFSHRSFPADTRFDNLSHSLMGARKVWVTPGTSSTALDLTQVQAGTFVPGLPETMHKVEALVRRVALLRTAADSLLAAGGATTLWEPLDAAHDLMTTLAASVEDGAATLHAGVAAMRSATHATERIAALTRAASPATDTAVARTQTRLTAARHAEASLANALTTLESLTGTLRDTAYVLGAGRLLDDSRMYDSLVHVVHALDAVTRSLKAGGLGDDIKINPRLKRNAP